MKTLGVLILFVTALALAAIVAQAPWDYTVTTRAGHRSSAPAPTTWIWDPPSPQPSPDNDLRGASIAWDRAGAELGVAAAVGITLAAIFFFAGRRQN